jgi:psiF repeat
MSKMSHPVWATMMVLLLATSLASLMNARTPQSKPAQSSTASSQDKAKTCNDAADKKGLTGQDRTTFMQTCLNKAAGTGSGGNVSEKDKSTACKNLADQKGLKGSDRRSFVKDCMNKANP